MGYGFNENSGTVRFHMGRRMFCIKDQTLFIAEPNLPYSHRTWFQKQGWDADRIIKECVRGMIDECGDVCFYRGRDFIIDKDAKLTFLKHIRELASRLSLRSDAKVFGGMIKQEVGKKWTSIKFFGELKGFI